MSIPAAILTVSNPVLGIDIHDMIIPPSPAPIPGPYVWGQLLPGLFIAAKIAPTVMASGSPIIQRASDMGPGLPHIGNYANINLPFIIFGSASKSEFGSFSVTAENKAVATAFPLVYVTYNLTCQGPVTFPAGPLPLPTGVVMAIPQTALVGMSLGDILASALGFITDMAIQSCINAMGGAVGNRIGNMLVGRVSQRVIFSTRLITILRNSTAVGNLYGWIMSSFVHGSPTGYSAGYTPAGHFGELQDEAYSDLATMIDHSDDPLRSYSHEHVETI